MIPELALIGFGEAGHRFAAAGQWGARARAYDLLPARQPIMVDCGVRPAASPVAALAGAGLILSLVTAGQALSAAESYAAHLAAGAIWCDMNSVAPDTKRAAARVIEAAGGRYVDVAVLAPVDPAGMAVPLLLSGAAAADARDGLVALGFGNVRIVGEKVGEAAAVKMIRSVIVKGIEALCAEMYLAGEAVGVTGEVIASLDASERPTSWAARLDHSLERMAVHGERRAAEMEEAARTLVSLGVEPVMTRGTVLRQRRMVAGSRQEGDVA